MYSVCYSQTGRTIYHYATDLTMRGAIDRGLAEAQKTKSNGKR